MEPLVTTLLHTIHNLYKARMQKIWQTVLRLATDMPKFIRFILKLIFSYLPFCKTSTCVIQTFHLSFASQITYLIAPLLPLRQNSPKHSPYLFFYSFSRSSSTLKPTVVSLMPPPLHWIIKWSSSWRMQWMLSRLPYLAYKPLWTLAMWPWESHSASLNLFSHQQKRDHSIFLAELLRDSKKWHVKKKESTVKHKRYSTKIKF